MRLIGLQDEDGTYDAIPDDDLFERIARFGGTKREKKPAPEIKDILGAKGANFETVQECLDELVILQGQINHRITVSKSPILSAGERIFGGAMQKMSGRPPAVRTIDELFDDQVRTVKSLNQAAKGAQKYSKAVLDYIVEYKNEKVLVEFTKSVGQRQKAELKAAELVDLYSAIDSRLSMTKVTDKSFAGLVRAYDEVKGALMRIDSEVEKHNQTIVFRDSELGVLTTYMELVQYGVHALDRLCKYVDEVAEHAQKTRGIYAFFRESEAGMHAVYSAFNELSRCVMFGARDMGDQIKMMSDMARSASGDSIVPDMLGRMMSGYKSTLIRADERSRARFDDRASKIMERYGRTEV